MTLSLPIEPQANELLSRDGFALLLAMMLDQQVPFEKAFNSPYQLALRLGHEPTAEEIAGFDPDALAAIFAERPALHRFPRAMAARAQELARVVVDRYAGDASALGAGAADGGGGWIGGWRGLPGRRIASEPAGVGEQAMLARQPAVADRGGPEHRRRLTDEVQDEVAAWRDHDRQDPLRQLRDHPRPVPA